MQSSKPLLTMLQQGDADAVLAGLYAPDGSPDALAAARSRALHVVREFQSHFPDPHFPVALFSGPGRTELGGNHTDHQHGHVLCASVDLDMLCCAAPNGSNTVRICSEGYPALEISLESLEARSEEQNTSAALVRGVAARITQLGYRCHGFDAYLTSNVLSGSGLSSSAAYEILIGTIFNQFDCRSQLDAVALAKIGQYAENVFFGKPCGLMDQMGASVGGAVAIDFADPAAPVVEKIPYDFARSGHVLCIIDTGSCHADLTNDYADIPKEMGAIAAQFGKSCLRELPAEQFYAALPLLREQCGDRAVLRAMHYYDDDQRALLESQALRSENFPEFLSLIHASGLSSSLHLQNTWSIADPRQQAIPIALALASRLLNGQGAVRVHGGGFAGTIQAFVPQKMLSAFRTGMEAVFGTGACHVLRIRPQGGCVLLCES